MSDVYANTTFPPHPIDFDADPEDPQAITVLAPGDRAEILRRDEQVKAYLETGQLTKVAEPTKAAKAQAKRGLEKAEEEGQI